MFKNMRNEWFFNIRGDLLSGLVVALALIPEAIAFSIIAGVDPKVGLYASFCIAVIIAFVGGSPGMISAATGAMALLMVTLVKQHGLEYLLAATLLTGVLQIVIGYLKLGNLMRFVSKSVVTGFVNALAILIFIAQLPQLTDVTWHVYAVTAVGLGIIYLFPLIPKIGKSIPSTLICIVVLTAAAIYLGLDVRTVGDMGELPDTLPIFLWPDVPLTLETLAIILPYSVGLAIVGLLESLMTANILDELTDSKSNRNQECKGQGIANIGAGLLGGMAGCAMIGQSVINIKSGGRGRLSTFCAGFFLLIMVVFLSDWIKQIPMAALVAVMIMVSIGSFSWSSVKDFKKHPLSSNIVMLTTVAVVLSTHNLALGVLAGVLLSALFFVNKIGRLMIVKQEQTGSELRYQVIGQVFFASAEKLFAAFDFSYATDKVIIDLTRAHFWDISAVAALDQIVIKYQRLGADVSIIGSNEASKTVIDKFGTHNSSQTIEKLMSDH